MVCPITYGDHKQDILIYRYAYGNFPHTVYAPLYYAKFGAFFCATIVRLCINQGTVWDPIEAVQKRAIRIIHIPTHGMPYLSMLFYANLSSLTSRKEDLSCRFFFGDMTDPASCLHSLLPHLDRRLSPQGLDPLKSFQKFTLARSATAPSYNTCMVLIITTTKSN